MTIRRPGSFASNAWHSRRDLLDRFCCDIVAAELRRQRPQHDLVSDPVRTRTIFGDDGLGLDSLERLRTAEALCEALRFQSGEGLEGLGSADSMAAMIEIVAAALPSQMPAPLFHTSGSTGIPKPVVHPWKVLDTEIAHWADLFSHGQRILALVPSHHIYGFLFTIALPALLGIPVVDARALTSASVMSMLTKGDIVVGHPLFWPVAARHDWPGNVIALSSGGPVDQASFRTIARNGASAFEIYGSTETSGVGLRHADEQDFALLPWWKRSADCLQRDDGTFVEAPDVLVWASDRQFTPAQRKDGQMQIAGINVSPDRVASVLRAHAAVRDASVRLMAPDEGERLKAFITTDVDHSHLRPSLERWCKEKLQPLERPRAFTFGSALPKTPEGKDSDWEI